MQNLISGQPYCDNSIFESLSDLYQVKTKYGTYVKNPVLTQDEIDAGVTLPPIVEVYIEAGDIAEVSCANGNFTVTQNLEMIHFTGDIYENCIPQLLLLFAFI